MMLLLSFLVNAHAMVGAIDITLAGRTCVETELRARTVRIEADRGKCSAAWITDHELRTAGHCFANARKLSFVRDVEGHDVANGGWVRRAGGANWSGTFDAPDHGEIRFEGAVVPLAPIALANLDLLPPDADVVVAGYGLTRPKRPYLKNLIGGRTRLKYYYGKLRVTDSRRGGRVYEITPVNPNSSVGLGDDGGPAFLVDGCRLQYLGTIVGRRVGLRTPTRVFVRPHADLPQ